MVGHSYKQNNDLKKKRPGFPNHQHVFAQLATEILDTPPKTNMSPKIGHLVSQPSFFNFQVPCAEVGTIERAWFFQFNRPFKIWCKTAHNPNLFELGMPVRENSPTHKGLSLKGLDVTGRVKLSIHLPLK